MKSTRDLPDASFEHSTITIADLVALISGIGVVLVLPTKQSYWPLPSDFLGPWPLWLPWFFCLRQALGAFCVALVPVVIWRRACYGGLARHAEFLLLGVAMPFLVESLETALIRLKYCLQTGQNPPGFGLQGMPIALVHEWQSSYHRVWEQGLLLTGAVGFVAFIAGRNKLSGWLLTVMLVLAWLGTYEGGLELLRAWIFPMIARVSGRPIGGVAGVWISSLVYDLPRFTLYSIPAISAFRDVRREATVRPTWLEWTGLGLASCLFLVAEPTELVRNYSFTRGQGTWAMESLARTATLLASVVLGLVLNRHAEGRWSRMATQLET
jgi:hypothetical protein